jgi:PAS domain S-box-containing protein
LRAKVVGFIELFQKTEQVKRQAELLQQMERRQFEQKLAEENARFRALTEHSSDAVTLVGADGTVLYSSPSSRGILGYEPDEFVGRSGFELVHPDDRERIGARLVELIQKPETPIRAEMRIQHKDGSWRWVECIGTNLLGEPAVEAVVVNFRDISERQQATEALRESEERFRQLAEHVNAVFWMSDPHKSRVLYVSPAYETVWGRSCSSLYREPRSFLEAVHPEDRERVNAESLERQVRGEATDVEYRIVRPDGSVRWVRDRSFPIRDQSGRVYRIAGITEDVTEAKKVEGALREADRRKDEFLAMLAHELRNPLAPIRNAAQIIKLLGPADPNLQLAGETIDRQVAHLARLVDDLLDVSRITRGKIELHTETVELAAVIARSVETSRPLIDARRQELTVVLPPESVYLEADMTRLAQVVSNLLNNAAKYTPEGGHIGLTIESDGSEAVVRVRDDGSGISADLLPRVFDLFTQGDRSLARSEGGLGIGLTLVRSLVEMHSGRVEAHSDGPGRGSEFVVRLPALRSVVRTAGSGEGEVWTPSPSSRRVLVVDDNVDSAESLAVLLRIEGHEVRTAHDGPAALQEAQAFRPEVVFLDIGLPRMDGYDVAVRLRELAGLREVLLVALTGYGQDEDRRRAAEAGFNAHLVKPANLAALKRLLANACQ